MKKGQLQIILNTYELTEIIRDYFKGEHEIGDVYFEVDKNVLKSSSGDNEVCEVYTLGTTICSVEQQVKEEF